MAALGRVNLLKIFMNKFLFSFLGLFALGIIVLPCAVLAAHDTVSFDANTDVYLWGIPLTLTIQSGTELADLTINSTTLDLSMENGSTITITSADKKLMTNNLGAPTTCGTSVSTLSISSGSTQGVSIDIGETCPSGSAIVSGGSSGGGGGGETVAAVAAPSVSGVQALNITTSSATVSWNTSGSSYTWLLWGKDTGYGSEKKTSAFAIVHSVDLTSLEPGTIYHYQIKTRSTSGSVASQADRSFSTLNADGTAPAQPATTEPAVTTPVTTGETIQLSAKPVSQMTVTELKAEIAKIATLISQLQAQLIEVFGTASSATVAGNQLTKNLKLGDSGSEVTLLQVWLARDPAVYPEGKVTGYFGALTKQAVIKFQEKYKAEILDPWNFTAGTGLVGQTTRAKLNALFGGQ